MQQLDVNQTILIVVGSDINPEEKDRPLAYYLKQAIEKSPEYGSLPFRKCIVISDSLYESDKIIQICPTISIGGPGVNALAARLAEKLPIQISKDDQFFVQYNENGGDSIVSIWGMDHETTKAAVELYIQDGYLDNFIKKVWV